MNNNEYLVNLFTYWQTCLPIVFNIIYLYFFVYCVGTLALLPFSKKLIETSALNVLSTKLLLGILILITFTSCYFTYGKTIHILLFFPLGYLGYKTFSLNCISRAHLNQHLSIDLKYFILSLSIPFFIVFIQFWKFDFFNPNQISVWCDYPYYTSIAKKMCIENIESSFYTIPFSSVSIPYHIYHYSDVWVSALFEKLAVGVNGVNVYAYLYFSIAATILLVSISSVITTADSIKNKNYLLFTTLVLLLFTSEIFHHFSHRLLISFALLLAICKFYNAGNVWFCFATLLVILIINPLFVILVPFLFLFIIINKFSQPLSSQKIIIACVTIAGIAIIYFYLNDSFRGLSANLKLMLYSELAEPNFLKLKYIAAFLISYNIFFKLNFEFNKHEIILFTISAVMILCYYFFDFSLLTNNSENFQLAWLLKRTAYLIISIIIFSKLVGVFSEFALYNKHAVLIFLFIVLLNIQCAYALFQYFNYSKDYNYYFNRKIVSELQNALPKQYNIVGYYKKYKSDNAHNQYTYQRASTSEFLSILESMQHKQAWLTPVFVHNKFEEITLEVKNNWRKTEYYNYKQNYALQSEAAVFQSFINKHQIKIIFTDVAASQLPVYIKSKIKKSQSFTIQTNQYTMLILK